MKNVFHFAIVCVLCAAPSIFAQTTGPTRTMTSSGIVSGFTSRPVSGFVSNPVSGFAPGPVSGFSPAPITGLTSGQVNSLTPRVAPLTSPVAGSGQLIAPNPNVVVVPQTRLIPRSNPPTTTGTNRVLVPLF